MAASDDRPENDPSLSSEERLKKVLESRWDPGKISRFMRSSAASKGQRLDAHQRGYFEKRLGIDLGGVRIFTGELADEITKAHGAEALTVGSTGIILMRQSPKFAAGSVDYTALLAHELTHVAQARPDAISRQATANPGQASEAEHEAEHAQAEVMAELLGDPSLKPTEGDKKDAEGEKKEKLLALVLELMEEERWMRPLRSGSELGIPYTRV